jgi:hypothetical protein
MPKKAPNYKHQAPNKSQSTKFKTLNKTVLGIRYWSLGFIWDL